MDLSRKRKTQLTDNILEQDETMQFEDNLKTYLQGKYEVFRIWMSVRVEPFALSLYTILMNSPIVQVELPQLFQKRFIAVWKRPIKNHQKLTLYLLVWQKQVSTYMIVMVLGSKRKPCSTIGAFISSTKINSRD